MFRRVRLVVLAENAPKDLADGITYYCKLAGVPIHIYRGSSIELGRACGKPFPVSALGVRDPGDSNVFELLGLELR